MVSCKVPLEAGIREGDALPVPLRPAMTLVAADKDGRVARWIESEQEPQVTTPGPQFLHVRVAGTAHRINEWPPERRAFFLKDLQGRHDSFTIPPV